MIERETKVVLIKRQRLTFINPAVCILICCSLLLLTSCTSLKRIPSSYFVKSFEKDFRLSLMQQSDLQLVKDGMPSFMMTLDSLALHDQRNRNIMLAKISAYEIYCRILLLEDDNWKRAGLLYDSSRDASLRLLQLTLSMENVVNSNQVDFENALNKVKIKDIPYLFAAASSWIGWILTHSDSLIAFADFPKPFAIMSKVMELDPYYNYGAPHLFYGIYYAIQPAGAGRDLTKSKNHFLKVMEQSQDEFLLSKVAFAEYYARAAFDEELFVTTLNAVMIAEVSKNENIRLFNEMAKVRARYLLNNKDQWF